MTTSAPARTITIQLPELRPDQAEIAHALHACQTVVLAMGRRWGKTVFGEVQCISTALHGGRVAWIVPSYKNGRPLWRTVRRVLAPLKSADLVRINETDRIVEFADALGGGFLGMYTAEDNCDAIRGEDMDLVIIDEAARVSEIAWTDSIAPTLADRAGKAVLISTPRGRNWFWREWMAGQDGASDVRSFHAPSSDNPNPNIKRAARLAGEKLPERTYRQEWLAEFVEDGGGVFRGVRDCIRGTAFTQTFNPHTKYVMGVDLAKYRDFTVCCVIDLGTRQVVALDRFNKAEWPLQKARIYAMAQQWHAALWLDSTGVGDPIYDDLRRFGLAIQPYKFTSATKTDLIENAVLLVEQQQVTYPDCTETRVLLSELEAYEYKKTAFGTLQMNAPDGMHDDCVIAFALACWPLGMRHKPLTSEQLKALNPTLPRSDFRGAAVMDKRF
jgi:hypothetical protein